MGNRKWVLAVLAVVAIYVAYKNAKAISPMLSRQKVARTIALLNQADN